MVLRIFVHDRDDNYNEGIFGTLKTEFQKQKIHYQQIDRPANRDQFIASITQCPQDTHLAFAHAEPNIESQWKKKAKENELVYVICISKTYDNYNTWNVVPPRCHNIRYICRETPGQNQLQAIRRFIEHLGYIHRGGEGQNQLNLDLLNPAGAHSPDEWDKLLAGCLLLSTDNARTNTLDEFFMEKFGEDFSDYDKDTKLRVLNSEIQKKK